MFNPKQFDSLAKKLFSALPEGLQNLEGEIHQQFRDILQAAFNKLELVSREEYDVQTKVLARTREKVAALEKQVEALMK